MKKKLSSKKCIAIALALVMIITSIPLTMVGAVTTGLYDPAPYWGDDPTDKYGAINTNFVATLNTDGSVSISFPDANAQKTYNGSADKTIDKYVFTLTKMQDNGERKEIYSEVFTKAQVATGTEGAKYPNNIYYGPGGLESLPDYDVQSTYDVAIMAIDSDGWFSDKIHTLLSDVPYYDISADFSPNETWVAREMLLFGGKGTAQINGETQTPDGKENNRDYMVYSGSKINTDGYLPGMGYDQTTGGAYRFWINGEYDGTPYSVQTTWSRSHYNFTNAQEVWFYVDFSRVNLTKVAFSLSSNQIVYTTWRNAKGTAKSSSYGDIFSTASVAGVNTGVITEGLYIQNDDGLWESTSMTDGYFTELSGYEGFIRIPIEYFILQEDQNLMHYSNSVKSEDFGNTLDALGNWVNSVSFLDSTYDKVILTDTNGTVKGEFTNTITEKISYKAANKDNWSEKDVSFINVVVNPAGTPVNEALLLHERFQKVTGNAIAGSPERSYEMGTMLSMDAPATTTINGTTVTYSIDYANAPKAISDMLSAGIEVAGWTDDSVAKSFYIDQVMFCQKAEGATFNTDGSVATTSSVKFPEEDGFAGDLGKKVAGYYDRTVEVPKAIANYITEYVGKTPSLDDVNALEMINEIILTYRQCFPTVLSTDNDTTTLEKAITYLNTLGYTDAYNRYVAAKTFIETYINLGDTARNYNAVIAFESGVELLPEPEFANYNDDSLKSELEQLMALYRSFNLSHFEILGAEAEKKFTELYSIMMGEEVKTGYSIGGYPFIPFNDFENNINGYDAGYSVGQQSLLYYDDYPNNASEDTKRYDVNNTKNFTTYLTSNTINQTPAVSGGSIGWSVQDYRASVDGGNNALVGSEYFGRMDAVISNKGFADSLGATLRLNGDLNSSATPYKFAVLSTTYKGQNASEWSNLQGLNLSALAVNTTTSDGLDSTDVTRYNGATPNSFVMYVDFTEVTGLVMNIKFILRDPDGYDVNCYFCAGYAEENPIIYLLDENGEWEEQALAQSNIDTDGSWFGDAKGVCSIGPSSLNTLEGYKGFIRIPLSNFRIPRHTGVGGSVVNNEFLDNIINSETYGNWSIVQTKVAFWDYTGANVGKDVTIDAMGFTYDPNCTTRKITDPATIINTLNANNGLNTNVEKYGIKNMDEYFGVKTNDSVEVEKMIAEIDPYVGKDKFIEDFNAVRTAYEKLSPYQKSLKEVDTAYNQLFYNKYYKLYEDYDNVIAQEPWVAKYATASALLTDLNALDSKATSFDITNKDNALVKPYDTDTGAINYTDLGIADKAEAERIVEIYEKGYARLSNAEKGNLSADDLAKLENAYDAAKRLLLLEDYIADMNSFKNEIIQIYTVGTAEPDVRMVSYANPNLLKAIEHYEDMSVFAKQMLSTTKDTANAGYPNMYAAAEAIYDNSHTITMSNGATIDGGVLVFEDRMLNCAADVEGKINARTVLDTTTLNEIEYCLGQTESFLPRYAQVDEINVAYHELAKLLPKADISTTTTQVLLTNAKDNEVYSYTTDVDLSYVAARLNRSISVYVASDYKWTQTTGSTYDFGYFTVNGATGTDGTTIYTKIGDYANGATAEINPVISVDETAAKKIPTGAQYSGNIKVVAFDSALITDGVDLSTLTPVAEVEIPVVFDSTNGSDPMVYEVQIPATVVVDWDDSLDKDVSYSVKATLGSNELSVNVSNDGTDVLINDDTGTTYELAYSKANFGTETFTGDVAEGTKPANAPSIKITGWDSVPVGAYSTQLTYTVDVTS